MVEVTDENGNTTTKEMSFDLEGDKHGNGVKIKEVSESDVAPTQADSADIEDVETDEITLNLVDDSDEDQMPSLDNIGDQLAAKSVEVVIPTEALATAATLLQDTIVTTDDTNVIKSVENQEPKEPVKNPDAPEVAKDENGVEIAEQEQADFIPDVHNQMPQDDEHDGSGITS